ncbi:methyltransferase [Chroococcidiopsis cubana SAG 39.79]|uniref:Methyltransferase n=1 Tax=Chroococcidiopsis cubana SAG 39.79 TaxID=388085 RepID=A0AB37U7R7_9CYAN|nr:class I SAM-dependent methyltransferase [Chroococcidiopsis cubana]PSB56126.1 SAM-dependent methyltransferase [Chroococcidiopsis cubana CCALA 043]RUS95517.1 methyltransferase [Chroococcidiopsis cubana SAG 39.79]
MLHNTKTSKLGSVAKIGTNLTYQAFQQGKNYFSLAHNLSALLLRLTTSPFELKSKRLPLEVIGKIQTRRNQLLETDWQDAERSIYPASLLFDNPWKDFLRYYPMIWLDMPSTWNRAERKQYEDFSPEIDTTGYPDYYRQTFHHQTDGYLSDRSANLYDLQVELLFSGTTDAMRRRILSPLKQGLKAFNSVSPQQIRVLDVACGTGRTIKLTRAALPQASLYGTDLSPAYLRKAEQLLSQNSGELPQLLQANAEELPYQDNYFHAITCVFLLHELPVMARQRVIEQCFRVIQPGGTFIICDSIQVKDSPEMIPAMEYFHDTFHEPYYKHYITDDLVERLEKAGFQNISTQVHFLSKYLIARKASV